MSSHSHITLKQELKDYLDALTGLSPSSLIQRTFFTRQLINDFKRMGCRLATLKAIKDETIINLVNLWKSKGNSIKTCQNKVSSLRSIVNFIDPNRTFPGYDVFELFNPGRNHRQRTAIALSRPVGSVSISPENIKDKRIRDICAIQRYFGLRKTEAIHFSYQWLGTDAIYLSRKHSHLAKNRVIPLWCQAQRDLLNQFGKLTTPNFLTPNLSPKLISYVHQYTLRNLGIEDDEYFRHEYMIERAKVLGLGTKEPNSSAQFEQLKTELGYECHLTLKEKLKCLGVY